MSVEQTNKSAVIRIHVPAVTIAGGLQAQIAEVRTGLAAATRLRAFYIQHKAKLDMVPQH